MLRELKTLALSAATLALIACNGAKETPSENALVTTTYGPVQGVTTDTDGIYNFKGLPFAAPPTGDLRWQAPIPPASWTDVKTADTFGPMCMQPSGTEDGLFDRIIEGHGLGATKEFLIRRVVAMQAEKDMSEDCLYLNIRTGNLNTDKKQPVMVWIHGGGHQFGSSDFSYYQANALVKKGVVLVTFNYRLGVMGYMAHPALSADDPNGVSGNYGSLDQIAALTWIRDNISAFGGDPDNVTLFGESAGAWSVTEMMASPLAAGLFHKAIGQSGASTYHLGQMDGNPVGWVSGYESGAHVIEALGLDTPTAEELRALPAQTLQAVITESMADGFHHNRDGHVFPENVGISFMTGNYHKVPTLFGYNTDEGTLFFPTDPEPSVWIEGLPQDGREAQIAKLSEAYDVETAKALVDLYALDTDFIQGGMDMMGDDIFGVNVRYVTQVNEANGQSAYAYIFGRVPPSPKQTLGAFHAAELPFVFGSHEPILGITEDDDALSERMQNYWVNFARTGNPNGADLPHWPMYDGQNWMQFGGNNDVETGLVTDFRKAKLDALESGMTRKLKDLQAWQNGAKIGEVSSPIGTMPSTVGSGPQ